MALVLKVNEQPYETNLNSLEDFQSVVNGYIEAIYLANGNVLIVNELGRLMGLPLNLMATTILLECSQHVDTIVGNAILVPYEELSEEIEEEEELGYSC